MSKIAVFAKKTTKLVPCIFLVLIIIGGCLQGYMQFSYVADPSSTGELVEQEENVEKNFGIQNPLVVLVDVDDISTQKEIANLIMSCEYINSTNALAITQLYDELTIEDLENLSLSTATIQNIYTYYNLDIDNDNIYLIELADYLTANENVYATNFNNYITTYYTILYSPVTKTQAMTQYYLTQAQADILYGENENVTFVALLNYIIINELPASESMQLQTIYAISSISYTYQELIEKYSLTEENATLLFQSIGKNIENDSIYNYELVYILYNNSSISLDIITAIQGQFETASAKGVTYSSMLTSDNYARLIFNLNLASDDENALEYISNLKTTLDETYGDGTIYLVNSTYNVLEEQTIFSSDRIKVDLITIFGIMLVVFLAFRSFSIPVILVLAIQGVIWINLAICTISQSATFFVCYLLAMAIQMGATIDYGILLTDRYVFLRRKINKYDAIEQAINKSFLTIITSGSILVLAAFTISWVSTVPMISQIGTLIGRGALLSSLTILFVVPQLLLLFDKLISKTTLNAKFNFEDKQIKDKIKEIEKNQ